MLHVYTHRILIFHDITAGRIRGK